MRAKSILVLAVVLVAAIPAVTEAGLIGYWNFDEGSGTTAFDSAGDNDGVIYGAEWVDGVIGGALDFDGEGDYMAVADAPSLRVNQNATFSISVWAKAYSNRMINSWMLSKMRADERHGVFGYSLAWEEQTSRFRFIVEESWHGSTSLYSSEVPAGIWYHVAVVYDNKDMRIYVNGVPDNSDMFARDTSDTEPDKEFVVGARSWDYTVDGYFDGLIDEVRIYDVALSEGEIRELALIPIPGPPINQPPLADAGFDQTIASLASGTAPVILDGSGSSDPDGDDLTYLWMWVVDGSTYIATGVNPIIALPIGQHTIELIVNDGIEDSEPDTTTVEIEMGQCIDDLAARPKSGKVQLTWTAKRYNIYRSTTANGPYTLIASTTSTYSTYLDEGLVDGTTYYYVVREAAVNGDELCQSNEASATPTARTRSR